MGFSPFVLLSLFYAVVGVRFVIRLVERRRQTFDRHLTAVDRAMVDQAAFFVLVPISVALHEMGHAVAIRLFGGAVEGWGYYLFAGYVSFNPAEFSHDQRVLIAIAGTAVNVLLAALALALVFGRRPPMRAAFNELLMQFTVLSLGNALIVYPLLDLSSGLNGDWTQVYRGDAPTLAGAIFAVHAAILIGGVLALRHDRIATRIAALTGLPPGARRAALGGVRPAPTDAERAEPMRPTESAVREAISRAVSGWPSKVELGIRRGADSSLFVLSWLSGDLQRSLLLWIGAEEIQISGAVDVGTMSPQPRLIRRVPAISDADSLTLALRLAMETVETWPPASLRPSMPFGRSPAIDHRES